MENIKEHTVWPYKEAYKLEGRIKKSDSDIILFEMGIGASGLPHIGSVGDALRANFVKTAMDDIGYKTKLIAFSDDKDGLRKVPIGFPEELKEYIGVPVSSIKDPFGCCDSYAKHMNNFLIDTLESMGIDYEFRSSFEEYAKGAFNEQIRKVIKNKDAVRKILREETGSEKEKDWYPIYVECSNCNNVYTTNIIDIDLEKDLVTHECVGEFKGNKGCGHSETISYLDGNAKLQWKADWAARHDAYGIDFECYGKDLIEAFNSSSRIVKEIFGNPNPPQGMFYELFTTSEGSKISKSIGNSFTAQDWMKYASKESLLLLMVKNPRKAREASVNIIPQYEREHNAIVERVYDDDGVFVGGDSNSALEYFLIHGRKPPEIKPKTLNFDSVCATIEVLEQDDQLIDNYLKNYFGDDYEDLVDGIEKSKRYVKEVVIPSRKEDDYYNNITVPREVLEDLSEFFKVSRTEKEIKDCMFGLVETHNLQKSDIFKTMYSIILKRDNGPKITTLATMLGNEKTKSLIDNVILDSE